MEICQTEHIDWLERTDLADAEGRGSQEDIVTLVLLHLCWYGTCAEANSWYTLFDKLGN